MFTVYPTKMKSMINMHKSFETETEAKEYVATRKNPDNYTIEFKGTKTDHTATNSEIATKDTKNKKSVSTGQKKASKIEINFEDAVRITRENVRHFYGKAGYIQVVNENGEVLHIGKTKNMGKVFSNYVNCARYNQSYDFNLDGTDQLFFKECLID